jgi:hypothetical protein
MKCLITDNECGTDTWTEGTFCCCENCIKWLSENMEDIDPEFSKTVDKHFWELF